MNIYLFIILAILAVIPAVYGLSGAVAGRKTKVEFEDDHYRIQNLVRKVRTAVNNRISDIPGRKDEGSIKRRILRARLQNAVREACLGDPGDREFLKDHIR